MGIVNITPDSFNPESRVSNSLEAIQLTEKQLKEGADWIDLGAMSSRPGAEIIDEQEEENRLLPVLKELVSAFPKTVFSVDTFRSVIAQKCLDLGASIINDISGGEGDKNMETLIAKSNVPYILMHSRGNPQTMKNLTHYNAFPEDIVAWFMYKIKSLHTAGVEDIIVDPGIGFAKTIKQNFTLIEKLNQFSVLEKPILMGISRKSFIAKTLETETADTLNGTSALHMTCLMNGAHILRVHDVKEAVEVRKLFTELKSKDK